MESNKCLRCGGARLEPCVLQSMGRIFIRPSNVSFWSFRTGDMQVDANVCLECGTVDLVADVKKAAAIAGRAPPD